MHDTNTDQNFRDSFQLACLYNGGKATYSQIFRLMEVGMDGYANPDFVRGRIQKGINTGSVKVAYGVLSAQGNVETVFSGLENEPKLQEGQSVEPVYSLDA